MPTFPKPQKPLPETVNKTAGKERNTLGQRPVKRAPGNPIRYIQPTMDNVHSEGFEAYPGSTEVSPKYSESKDDRLDEQQDSGAESYNMRDQDTMGYKKVKAPPFGHHEKIMGRSNARYAIYRRVGKYDDSRDRLMKGAATKSAEFTTPGQAIAWLKSHERKLRGEGAETVMTHDALNNPLLSAMYPGAMSVLYTVVLEVGIDASVKILRSAK